MADFAPTALLAKLRLYSDDKICRRTLKNNPMNDSSSVDWTQMRSW